MASLTLSGLQSPIIVLSIVHEVQKISMLTAVVLVQPFGRILYLNFRLISTSPSNRQRSLSVTSPFSTSIHKNFGLNMADSGSLIILGVISCRSIQTSAYRSKLVKDQFNLSHWL